MKTNLFMALAFAFLMLFAACTEEKIIYIEKENYVELLPGEGVIKISLSNSLETKAARPITGGDATNNVNRIAFWFFYSDGTIYKPTIAESDLYTIDSSGSNTNVLALGDEDLLENNESLTVRFEDMEEGSWKILAIGYNAEIGDYELPYNIETSGGNIRIFNQNQIKLTPKQGESMSPVEEIFAGISSTTNVYEKVNEFGNFVNSDITITITRQVAGLLAYMSEVPAKVKVTDEDTKTEVDKEIKKITISIPFSATGLYVPDNSTKGYNGIGTWSATDFTTLLTFEIPDDATVDGSSGCYEFVGNNVFAEENENQDYEIDFSGEEQNSPKNTMFGSCFLIPYNQHYNNYSSHNRGTLYICYYGDKDELLVYKPLRFDVDEDSELSDPQNSDYEYDIKCNHFYSIGSLSNGPLPINLESGSDNLKVIIDADWTEIHNMTNK